MATVAAMQRRVSSASVVPGKPLQGLKLEVLKESLLRIGEELGGLIIDSTGAIGIDDLMLQNIISRIVEASNVQHREVQGMLDDLDSIQESQSHLSQTATSIEARVSDLEAASLELRVQVGTCATPDVSPRPNDGSPSGDGGGRGDSDNKGAARSAFGSSAEAEQRIDDLARRLDVVEGGQADADRCQFRVGQCEETLRKLQDALDEIDHHLAGSDDTATTLRTDIEGMRGHFHDVCARKAGKADIAELQHQIHIMTEEQKLEKTVLEDAKKSLVQLSLCMDLAHENKARAEEIWRITRQGQQDVRDYLNRSINDIRKALSLKMDSGTVLDNIEDVRVQVKRNHQQMMEVHMHAQTDVQCKASASELVKLQDKLGGLEEGLSSAMRRQFMGQPDKQALIGNKCLSCNQVMSQTDLTPQACIDVEKARQQEELYKEVQKTLSKLPLGEKGQDVLKFVAVKVGASRKEGGFDVREDSGDAVHSVLFRSPKPLRPCSKQRDRGQDGAERSPARVVPPLVHIPRKVQSQSTHASMRSALGPLQPPNSAKGGARPGGAATARGAAEGYDAFGDPMLSQHSLASATTWPSESSIGH